MYTEKESEIYLFVDFSCVLLFFSQVISFEAFESKTLCTRFVIIIIIISVGLILWVEHIRSGGVIWKRHMIYTEWEVHNNDNAEQRINTGHCTDWKGSWKLIEIIQTSL